MVVMREIRTEFPSHGGIGASQSSVSLQTVTQDPKGRGSLQTLVINGSTKEIDGLEERCRERDEG